MNAGMRLEPLVNDFARVRTQTEVLAAPLSAEDQCVQSMPDASPTKWHRAHTAWFFETFVLRPAGHERLSPESFDVMFNSYYNAVGAQYHRPSRGLLTRPSHRQVAEYREQVDQAILSLLSSGLDDALTARVVLGLHHEQQHQELMMTDIKHLLSFNPIDCAYSDSELPPHEDPQSLALRWAHHEGGAVQVGFEGESFHFDNEGPPHEVLLHPFSIAQRLVTNREYLDFMNDDGYARPQLWLSAGWSHVQEREWNAPMYWQNEGDDWSTLTLHGRGPVRLGDPVTHVSYYEADAYARWAGARLPTEHEWEVITPEPEHAELCDKAPWTHAAQPRIYGACWQWTQSAYAPYPRYRPADGAIGEYNGKFMCGQYVLRGSSFATPAGHARRTYRNFFPPDARWQLSGIRLAQDEGMGTDVRV